MDTSALPLLLGLATLLPLVSFFLILLFGPKMGKGLGYGSYVATGAILGSAVLSFISLFFIWLPNHFPEGSHHAEDHADQVEQAELANGPTFVSLMESEGDADHAKAPHDGEQHAGEDKHATEHGGHEVNGPGEYVSGDYYVLGNFGKLKLTISYYIDSLTVVMFCMVSLIATCIHFYAMGYMHDELDEPYEDHEVTLEDGSHLKRPGRYWRFFQSMSLFCFSMLGLVLAGNIAMVFVFWELVGICSYFLIGFYIERKSASTAANKAFIVNRIGDFGMIIGLMAIWAGLGTFAFGDAEIKDADGNVVATEEGLFTLVRPADNNYAIQTPDGLVKLGARSEVGDVVRTLGPEATEEEIDAEIAEHIDSWRAADSSGGKPGYGYWLLIIGGLGIFCGCVGKSAQFPLHVWLPDAMEGPTPVSALVHSATMVAAGVYLVGRFFPMFVPEVLLVIAIVGCITLFMAATIAITATDIKRVLAYSTVSQLGYMMLAMGVGGWAAGLMHLITHAFFKSLLFMCSGSVIHAVHSNEMTEMGGLRKKMPITAYTMLVGCLAIAGVSIPFVVGFSGYYSKDAILEQAYSFMGRNGGLLGNLFFAAACGGAAITAFYMFRMWYMTFAGQPRNQHRYDHAHESPKVMYVPLIILAFFATTVAWQPFGFLGDFSNLSLVNLLEQSRPMGTLADAHGEITSMVWPNEHDSHDWAIKFPVTLMATATALGGILLATVMYCWGYVNPAEVRKQFSAIYTFLRNKWYFDELYDFVFVRPTLKISSWAANFDRRVIDWMVDGSAWCTRTFATAWEKIADQTIVDGFVNGMARWLYAAGLSFRAIQTGRIRQYVVFIVIGMVAVFVLISFFWSPTLAR